MGKKGVSKLAGDIHPIVGKKYHYTVAEWYPDTPLAERLPEHVTWELFKKRKDGRFSTTHIKKVGISDFTFGEKAVGGTYRLECYLYNPEGGGLIITPQPTKIPKINKIDLLYVDDKKGSTFSFMETLRARAHCVNMFNKELVFTLWEDDAKGAGHNSANKPIASVKKRVDKNGIATAEFPLSQALMKKAMQGEADVKQLEFYVTVEYYKNKKHASENVNVDNPFPTVPINAPKKTAPAKPSVAKGSPAEAKGQSKKEEKKVWDEVRESAAKVGAELWDWAESAGTAIKDILPNFSEPEGKSPAQVKETNLPTTAHDDEKVCECEARVRAYMRMLRVGEGTGELIKSSKYNKLTKKNEIIYIANDFEAGYTKLFGGGDFTKPPHNKDMSNHPQIKILYYTKKNGEKVYSSAAGAYQVMGYNWIDKNMTDYRKTYNIQDFTAESQDKYCIVLFKHKRAGMLDMIIDGNIQGATEIYGSYEWASLPPGRYGQPIETMEKALELYDKFYQEELLGKTPLHLKKGFLRDFDYDCCDKVSKVPVITTQCGKKEIDLRDKVLWQSQFDSKWGDRNKQMVACKKTCDDILINNGLMATSLTNLFQTALENDEHTVLNINTSVSKIAVAYLDNELEKGHPVQVGVDHGIGYKINNNTDHTTDHFVVIVGRKCDGTRCYYLFYDVGTSHKDKGASDNNRLYLDVTDYSLKGKTVYNNNFYTVTQIRKNSIK